MTKALLGITCAALWLCEPARAETFWQKVLQITGVSATPSQQKAPGMEADGELWMGSINSGSVRKLCEETGFRSPIFTPDNQAVLAIKKETLWRIPVAAGPRRKLYEIPGLMKLVGVDSSDPDKVLVLTEREQKLAVAMLSIGTGETTAIQYDANLPENRKMLSHLKGWERVYGQTKLFLQPRTREGLAGTVEWNDVFVKKGEAAPVNVSHSDGANCGQPSLSPDGLWVVFIRAKE